MKIAVVGDIHGCWQDFDTAFFNASDVDGILFTGDLPRVTGAETFVIASRIARLKKPYALIAGNHDCTTLPALLGEIAKVDVASVIAAGKIADRYARLRDILGEHLVGYSTVRWNGLTVVGARPFAMDGARLSYAPVLDRLFGVRSLADSAAKLSAVLQEAAGPVIILAHNGPQGLGAQRDDMFGIDFRSAAGDNGDADLTQAIAGARDKIRMVVAGHMHHAVRGMPGIRRRFQQERDGILYVNGARVPRYAGGKAFYLQAEMNPEGIRLEEVAYDRSTLSVVPVTMVGP